MLQMAVPGSHISCQSTTWYDVSFRLAVPALRTLALLIYCQPHNHAICIYSWRHWHPFLALGPEGVVGCVSGPLCIFFLLLGSTLDPSVLSVCSLQLWFTEPHHHVNPHDGHFLRREKKT